MTKGFARLPDGGRYILANATVPQAVVVGFEGEDVGEGLTRADIVVADGRIEALRPAGTAAGAAVFDMDAGQVWPTFVDMHTHLDKGHILARTHNPDGTFPGALNAVEVDRDANWTAADVGPRMDFAIRCAYAHGTSLIRTHIDSTPPQFPASWPVFSEMREKWAGKVDLQGVGLTPIERYLDPDFSARLCETVIEHRGVLGGVTYMIPQLRDGLKRLFFLAAENGLDVDLHVDETADPTARSLRAIAEVAIETQFEGQVVVGHCCSLARQEAEEADETMDLVANAGLAVVSLPMCNMYLQDRHRGRTPRWRGVTLLHEMRARGISVAVASDNTRDPFYAYGDLDSVEVYREAVRILQLDHPIDAAPCVVTTTPADIVRQSGAGRIAVGGKADLVLFRARSWSEFLARPQADRTVIRGGAAIDTTLPDYRELDFLFRR